MPKDGLALVFGEPRGEGMQMPSTTDEDYPPGFEDACEAAFDAVRSKDSTGFCRAIFDAIKAYEEAPHDEGGSEESEYEDTE